MNWTLLADSLSMMSKQRRLVGPWIYSEPDYIDIDDMLRRLRRLLIGTPGDREAVTQLKQLFDILVHWIRWSRQTCDRVADGEEIRQTAEADACALLESLPGIQHAQELDAEAALRGDPSAYSYEEVLMAYPGLYAVTVYRLAHLLQQRRVPLLPRLWTEHAHRLTGIDIHPGARIGNGFFIDHGTGVVIGETADIGDGVRLYQGVTLGALSLPEQKNGDEEPHRTTPAKRHPTLEDDVVVYAGATILGGETIVGRGSVIGGNVWLTSSVPARSRVLYRASHDVRGPKSDLASGWKSEGAVTKEEGESE